MSKKYKYAYATLRYIHDIMTGEFINVGVVLVMPDQGFANGKFRTTMGRIKSAFPDMNSHAFQESMKSVRNGLRLAKKHDTAINLIEPKASINKIMHNIIKHDDSSLQWSPVSAGISHESSEEILERLYATFVGKYDEKRSVRKSDEDVWRPVKEKLQSIGVKVDFSEKHIAGSVDQVTFKHTWKNGIWHAYEPVSLDLSSSERIKDKARKWRGQLEASTNGAPQNIALNFILGKPEDEKLVSAYRDAVKILEGSPFDPKIFDEDSTDTLIDSIVQEYRNHISG